MVPSPLRLRLDGDALVANWRLLARMSGAAACGAAIKADGYGLGAQAVVARLAEAGCRDFFVATWNEALALGRSDVGVSVLHGVRGGGHGRRGRGGGPAGAQYASNRYGAGARRAGACAT